MNKYLIKMHARAAAYHIAEAKAEKRKAALHETAAKESYKSAGSIVSECHKSLACEHEECAERHEDEAEYHIKCAKSLGLDTHDDSRGTDELRAAAGSEPFGMFAAKDASDLNKLVPTSARKVMPSDIPNEGRLIGRPGGPPIESEQDPGAALDRFAHSSDEIQKAILR